MYVCENCFAWIKELGKQLAESGSIVILVCRCGTNNSAFFAEIVPEQKRSTVYAFDRSFEGAVAACAAPVVGALFGYGSSLL